MIAQSHKTGSAKATRQKAEAKAGTPASDEKRTKRGEIPIAQAPKIKAVKPIRSIPLRGVEAVEGEEAVILLVVLFSNECFLWHD
jgi:hypothetical protein